MLQVFSFGGGVQSTAALVLAAQGKLDYRTFLFSNVGHDSENPDTLTYVEQIAKPFAAKHSLNLIELQRTWKTGERAGQPITLYGLLTDPRRKSPGGIPIRLQSGAPASRNCTVDFKIRVVDDWLKQQGALAGGAIVGLGISFDERLRVRYPLTDEETPWKTRAYPLVDRCLTRQDCLNIIKVAGLPAPPKSSCYFCPYHRLPVWRELRNTHPDLFAKACQLEALLRRRAHERGKGEIWLTDQRKPLAEAVTNYQQASLFEDEHICESGYCLV